MLVDHPHLCLLTLSPLRADVDLFLYQLSSMMFSITTSIHFWRRAKCPLQLIISQFLPLEIPSTNLRKRINSSQSLSPPDSHYPQTKVSLSQDQEWLQRSRSERPEKEMSLVRRKTTTHWAWVLQICSDQTGHCSCLWCGHPQLLSHLSCRSLLLAAASHFLPSVAWGHPPATGVKLHNCDRSSGSALVLLLPNCFFPWAPCQWNCSPVMWCCHCQ